MIVAALAAFTACGNNNETNENAGEEATTASTSAVETEATEGTGTMNEETVPADAGTTTDTAATTSEPAH